MTGQHFARNLTRANVAPRDAHAIKAYTSAPKFCEVVDPAECHSMGHITVVINDGAPVVKRWHHQEKTEAASGAKQMMAAWR